MAIVKCFKHWRHYLDGISHTIKVWSDYLNLQGFIKQPRINGRQARWLIYLTPYDFIIRHRPGSLNPADRPSRRPDFPAQGWEIPGQKDLLAKRLVGSDLRVIDIPLNPELQARHLPGSLNPNGGPRPDLTGQAREIASLAQTDLLASKLGGIDSDQLKAASSNYPLCKVAKCKLCEVANKAISDS